MFTLKKAWFFLTILLLAMSALHAATQPKFDLTPITSNVIALPVNGETLVEYRVLNQTEKTRALTMVAIPGVTPVTSGTGVCGNPFTLAPQQSCILKLSVNGSQIPASITRGPEICAATSNNSPSPFLCSQPSLINSLTITRGPVERATLTVSPPLRLFVVTGVTKSFTVTNQSTTVTATNVSGRLGGTALDGNVVQNASDCTSLAPGASCTLSFTSQSVSARARFPIAGDNTKIVPATIVIELPSTASISASPTEITLVATTGTPVPQSIFITNRTVGIVAANIKADISGVLADAGVVQDFSDCASLSSGETCELVFTPASEAAPTQTVTIKGDNTAEITVSIGVNGAPLVPISIISGNDAVLLGDGQSQSTMILQNTSSTETALSIDAHLGSSTLSGLIEVVSNNCGSVAHGAQCTIVFQTAPTTTQVTGTFPIYGTNTGEAIGTLTVTPVPFAYVSDISIDSVSHCRIEGDGSLTGCVNDVTSLAAPEGVALDATNTLAYFTDQGSNTIQKCDVTANTGVLTGCVNSGATGSALTGNTQGLVFHPVLTNLVYVPCHPSTLSICPLNADGTIGACTDSTPTGSTFLIGMAFNPAGTKAYLVNGSSPVAVNLCDVDTANGALTNCADSLADNLASTVAGIAITSDSQKAYISGDDFITTCDVNNDGTLTGCTKSSQFTALGLGVNIALNTAETEAYVTTDAGTVAICTIDSITRLISSCVATASSLWARTSGLALLQ